MNIQLHPLTGFGKPYLNLQNRKNINNQHQTSYSTSLTMPPADTVSFRSGAKVASGIWSDLSIRTYRDTIDEMTPRFKNFANILSDYLENLRGIKKLSSRMKAPSSLEPKMNSRKFNSKDAIRKLGDTGGFRIVWNQNVSRSEIQATLAAIEKFFSKNSKYKLNEIEVYKNNNFRYATDKELEVLKPYIRKGITTNEYKSGYPAIHLEVQNGEDIYEVQLMGENVEKFKEIEDDFYKIKCRKPLKKITKKEYKRKILEKTHSKNLQELQKKIGVTNIEDHLDKRWYYYITTFKELEKKLNEAFEYLQSQELQNGETAVKYLNDYTKATYKKQLEVISKKKNHSKLSSNDIEFAPFEEYLYLSTKNNKSLKNIFEDEEHNLLNFENYIREKRRCEKHLFSLFES